jgi:putative transposase
MKRRFSEEQIIGLVKRHEKGEKVKELIRELGISNQTFYAWKKKFAGMEVSEAKRLRSLESENGRLKRMVADLSLDIQILKEVNSKKW